MRLFEDPWGRIKQLDEKELLKLLDAETTEIAAVVLSKLDFHQGRRITGRNAGTTRTQDQLCHLTNRRRDAAGR